MNNKKFNIRFAALTCVLSLLAAHLSPATAAPASQLVTCIDLHSGKERISKNGTCRVTHEAQAKWRLIQPDSPIATGSSSKSLTICANKESSPVSYQIIRNKCARHQVLSLYSRSTALASKPVIAQVVSFGHDSSQISLAQDPATNPDAPIAYYTITSSKGNTQKIFSWRELNLVISGLQALTTYTFTVTATTVDGTSPVSAESIAVTTPAYVPPAPAVTSSPTVPSPPVAAPAFTLSALAETRTVNTAALGFTVASNTGGTVASYAISATPPGMTFNASTGALTGTPTTIATATSYTVTATNASGTATRSFTLTVTAVVYTVGSVGPGGGIVFYVATTPFACGPTLSLTCNYLEAAPTTGTDAWTDARYSWSDTFTAIGSTSTAIGTGYSNTLAMKAQSASPGIAGTLSQDFRGPNNLTDWFLPSRDELNEMYLRKDIIGNLTNNYYWSSSEYDASSGLDHGFGDNNKTFDYKNEGYVYVRPIRAF